MSGQQHRTDFPSQPTLQRSLHATVILTGNGTNGDRIITCAGVFVSPRIVLTAAHCVSTDLVIQTRYGVFRLPTVTSPVGKKHEIVTYSDFLRTGINRTVTFETIKFSDERDLALLRWAAEDGEQYEATTVSISYARAQIGTPLFKVGHPAMIPYNVGTGFISSRVNFDGTTYRVFSSILVYNGDSGGPVFDMNGGLVAICSQFKRTPHLSRSIYKRTIREFVEGML